jgi:hypothetical protein
LNFTLFYDHRVIFKDYFFVHRDHIYMGKCQGFSVLSEGSRSLKNED